MSTLADISVGARVRVGKVDGSDAVSLRLLEMGLTPGVELALVGTAPFGDPLQVKLRGYRLSLRRRDAARVEVEPA